MIRIAIDLPMDWLTSNIDGLNGGWKESYGDGD